MSGLAGYVALAGGLDVGFLERAARATAYLGPDGTDVWTSPSAGMVRFRHATTPEAVHERQPAVDPRTGLVVCFDGRLDNRDELLRTLAGSGLDTRSTDSDIVLGLVGRLGDAGFDRLVGDYAIAVWQPSDRRLVLARSPAGWRPLYWCRHGDALVFATEPKAIVDGLPLPRRLNEAAVAEFLALRFTTQTETFWEGIERVPPGSALIVEGESVRSWHWYRGPFPENDLDEAGHVARFRELFDQSLVATTRGNTPVGAHLSGGLDSSSIVCRAAALVRRGAIAGPIEPISARYPGQPHDETAYSAAVEAHAGVEAAVVTGAPYVWDKAAEWCATTLHLPLRPNVMGTIVAPCDLLRSRGSRVLLTGEGGDDFLMGSTAHLADLLRKGDVRRLLREATASVPAHRRHRWFARVARDSVMPLVSQRARARVEGIHLQFTLDVPDWIRPTWAGEVALQDRWRDDRLPIHLDSLSQRQRFRPLYFARRHVNVDNVVAFAATRGVELRHPFYDRRLAEFLLATPGGLLQRGYTRKYLLREAMRGDLPEMVRTRSTKANFTTPFVDAVLDRLEATRVDDLEVVRRGWVDGPRLDAMVDVYRRWAAHGDRNRFPTEPLAPVYVALATDLWLRHAFAG